MPAPKKKPTTKRKTKAASEGVVAAAKVSEEPARLGPPLTVYTPELAEEICERIANGETLRQACRLKGINESTVRKWVLSDINGFSAHYARARELCLECWADEIVEISDEATNDWMMREGKDGEGTAYSVNGEHVSRSKLRTENRKWLLSKLKPKVYGEGTQRVEVGKPGEFAELEDMSDADLADIARGSGGRTPAQTNGAARSSQLH
jgi:hypothetical protein